MPDKIVAALEEYACLYKTVDAQDSYKVAEQIKEIAIQESGLYDALSRRCRTKFRVEWKILELLREIKKRGIRHTSKCNIHAFDGMTGLGRKTMEDCGYNDDCDCRLERVLNILDSVISAIEEKAEVHHA